MREIDKNRPSWGKAQKTINFDKIVLDALEKRAQKENTTVSNLVNLMCRRAALSEKEFYREMSRYYYMKFQEALYLKDQLLP